MPLLVAAPPKGAGGETGGPLLVPLSLKEKDSNKDNDVRVVSSVGDTSRDRSPCLSVTKPLAMKAGPARHPAVLQVHHRKILASLPLHRPRRRKR
jgi:hypothetical protein